MRRSVIACSVAALAVAMLSGCQNNQTVPAPPAACPPPPPVQCPEPVIAPPAYAPPAYVPIEHVPAEHRCPPIPACPPRPIKLEPAKPQAPILATARIIDGKILVGEAEYASVQPGNLRLDARIDSGATTTSLHATNIRLFERDGQPWVRFTTTNGRGNAVTLELPTVRHVRIKGEGGDYERRPVVLIEVQIGHSRQKVEASLTDRANYTYPLLIGRNFLRDNVIIDISRKYVQGGKIDTTPK